MPDEHPTGPFADVSDGGKVREGDFYHACHPGFFAGADFFPAFPNGSPVQFCERLSGKLVKFGVLPVSRERDRFGEIA